LPIEIVEKSLVLKQQINDHNFDIDRAGGSFGANEFRRSLQARLDTIRQDALSLSALVRGAADGSTTS
jgi:hypothetical protein